MYGCETLVTTKYLLSRFDAFDTWALRKILRIPYTRHVSNAEVRRTTGCSPLSHLVTRRLRLFGDIAHSSPREDHHRALAAAIRQVRPDWKRPIRRPSHTWLRAIQADRGPLNFGLTTAWRQALLEMNSDILWTQQCSSGVHYERRRRCHDLPCLCHIVIAIARSHFSECHILRVSRTLQLVCVHSPYV